ncbi:MAG TPA: hypothetical protein VK453_28220 [Micromonosporaceae bacterium]|nr:hypothetical protein [Micromonosporaceae bacterium]
MRHPVRASVAAAAAVLALAGCGTSADPGAQTAPGSGAGSAAPGSAPAGSAPAGSDQHGWDTASMPDPCRTITLAEVTAVVTGPVTGGVRLDSWPPLCTFTMPGPPEGFLYVSDDSRTTGKDDFDRQRSDSAATGQVPGIGDQAYWLPEYSALHVLSGATHLTVKFAGDKVPADPRDKALALARVALPRATAAS